MKKVLKGLLLSVILLGVGLGSAWWGRSLGEGEDRVDPLTDTTTSQDSSDVASGQKATVIFSGDFKSGGDCHDHFTEGCDLFQATVDLQSGAVTAVQDLVTGEDAETFPHLSREGGVLTYIATRDGKDAAMLLDLPSGETQVLSQTGTHPFPSVDGRTAYMTLSNGFQLATVDLSSVRVSVQNVSGVLSAHEPQLSSQGLVAFYALTQGENRGSGTAQAMIYIPTTGKTVEVSEADGSAHCYWNFDGSELYCNNRRGGGVLSYPVSSEGTVGDSHVAIPFPTAEELESVDPEFTAACTTVSVEYGSFCDANHVVLTAGCYVPSSGTLEQKFTQLVLYNVDSKSYLPLGHNLAEAYGAGQGTTWTGTCALSD